MTWDHHVLAEPRLNTARLPTFTRRSCAVGTGRAQGRGAV